MLEITVDDANISLFPNKQDTHTSSNDVYEFRDKYGKLWIEVERSDTRFNLKQKDERIIETEESLKLKLNLIFPSIIESELSGTEITDTEEELNNPYNPDDIRVNPKTFSLPLILDMIDIGDIDLNPDFQRNRVWDRKQKSRLIESILLRIPLPMFYFSENDEGRITVIDGLQRLTTIKEFTENKFYLSNLEYLQDTCNGCYYNKEGNKKIIAPKYLRWFKQTQFSVNVIAPSSPTEVKYDIFRRINTGGTPLNNQEIRNCFASKNLRSLLQEMAESESFKIATNYGIKSTRMEDQEVALRFLLFYRMKKSNGNIDHYDGYINTALDSLTETLRVINNDDRELYLKRYRCAMENSEHLFGKKHAFRKIRGHNLMPEAKQLLINKALFVCWSVILADHDPEEVKAKYYTGELLEPLANRIENDEKLYSYLSYGTNGKANLLYALKACEELFREL